MASDGRFEHALVVGGTGMLRAATLELGRRSDTLTSVARSRRSLERLDADLATSGCAHRMFALDWREPDAFIDALEGAVVGGEAALPPPGLVVAWLHDDHLGLLIGRLLAGWATPCSFFQVLGSSAGTPGSDSLEVASALALLPSLAYHQVILGRRREGARSRWLTNAEISQGVLEAIALARPRHVVGAVEV